jgi:molybdate transport system substrate-binding protein
VAAVLALVLCGYAGRVAAQASAPAGSAARRGVLIFAAASLQTVLDEITPQLQAATGVPVRVSYAASSALARQLASGAPADMFISADLDWMDEVASRGLIQTATRINFLGNALVLVAPASAPVHLTIAKDFPLAAALGRGGRLALADPDSVPAGKYAKQALTSLGVWASVATRIAAAENVRAALRLVSRGETPLGIVYRTDAIAEPGVEIVDTFPAGSHAPIVYPLALTSSASPAAATVLAYLRSAAAEPVFVRAGFSIVHEARNSRR